MEKQNLAKCFQVIAINKECVQKCVKRSKTLLYYIPGSCGQFTANFFIIIIIITIMRWIRRLHRGFGAPFLILISSIYWTQGFRTLPWMGISYQLKDELKLSPSASQFAISVAFMPWSVKPVYGILSDCLPIRGSRRISYLIISSVLSFAPWILLGLVEPIRLSSLCLTGLLTVQNLGAAMADVVIDAMIAEAARKERGEHAGDLQSLSWFAMALGGMCGSIAGSFALSVFGVNGIFLFFSIFPLSQLFVCGFIDEKGLTDGAIEYDSRSDKKDEAEGRTEQMQTVKRHVSFSNPLIGGPIDNDGIKVGKVQVQTLVDASDDGITKADGSGVAAYENGSAEEIKDQQATDYMEDTTKECEDHMILAYNRNLVDEDEDEDWVEIEATHLEEVSEGGDSCVKRNTKVEFFPLDGVHQLERFDSFDQDGLRRRRGELEIDGAETRSTKEVELKKSGVSLSSNIKWTMSGLFQAIKQPAIHKPMLWFFLAQITIPSLSTIMFYYQTNYLHFDSSFLGTSRLIGWGALMLGTFVYNRYLKHVELRKIFWWTHIALAIITLSDMILVTRINKWLGIPDKAFVIGAGALGDAINQFKFMPFLVLSGRLCQPGIEGTLFALFMSLNNLATTLSSFFGAGLSSALHISSDKFENFGIGICIQALCTVIPIFFLHLIPIGATGALKNSSD